MLRQIYDLSNLEKEDGQQAQHLHAQQHLDMLAPLMQAPPAQLAGAMGAAGAAAAPGSGRDRVSLSL
jgi:hypothetical protein